MRDTAEHLREELKDPEYSEGYAESFLDSYIATQIKVLREQAELSQKALAELIGTRQGVISRIENVNYSNWNVSTLKKLARAFRVRVKVSFETYGSLLADVASFSKESLMREPRELDQLLNAPAVVVQPGVRHARTNHRRKMHPSALNGAPTGFMHSPFESRLRNGSVSGAAAQAVVLGPATVAEMAQGNKWNR